MITSYNNSKCRSITVGSCIFTPTMDAEMAKLLAQQSMEAYSTSYHVHPESYSFMESALQMGARQYYELTVEEAREQWDNMCTTMAGSVDFKGSVKEIRIPSPFSKHGIPVTAYKPDTAPETAAILVYFHGGGLVLGGRSSCDACLRIISEQSGAIVVSVDYRLLPDASAPYAPFDDAAVAIRWVLANRQALGGRSDCRVGVGGDDAGGTLAISVSHEVSGLDFQLLVFPLTDLSRTQPSFGEFESIGGVSRENLDWFFGHSFDRMPGYLKDPRVNAVLQSAAGGSRPPRTLVIVAELDPLRDAVLEYAGKLRDASVEIQCELIKGVTHGFFSLCQVFETKCKESFVHVVKFLNTFH